MSWGRTLARQITRKEEAMRKRKPLALRDTRHGLRAIAWMERALAAAYDNRVESVADCLEMAMLHLHNDPHAAEGDILLAASPESFGYWRREAYYHLSLHPEEPDTAGDTP